MKSELTLEQSAKLIKLGVSPEKASESKYNRYYQRYNPIFTLTDILDILPKAINRGHLKIEHDGELWHAYYDIMTLCNSISSEGRLIDALYLLLQWCIDKGYVKLTENV